MLRFLSSPLWRAYTSTYVEGYRLLRGWLDERPADRSLTARFGRLLDEPADPVDPLAAGPTRATRSFPVAVGTLG